MKAITLLITTVIITIVYWNFKKQPRIIIAGASVTRTLNIENNATLELEKKLNSPKFLNSIKAELSDFKDLTATWNHANVTFNVDAYNQIHNIVFTVPTYSTIYGEFSLNQGFLLIHGNHPTLNKIVSNRTKKIMETVEERIKETLDIEE
ncbi:MAG: hypothetical protein NE334_02520 [Lentisphaeraceae bacterium]|nr:hypothetical protein [Lentisphaeraceae bacterium]